MQRQQPRCAIVLSVPTSLVPESGIEVLDQASGLRRMLQRPCVRVLPVIGSDGARWVATMLSEALVRLGERVLLIEQGSATDRQQPVESSPTHSLDDLLGDRCEYADAVVVARSGVQCAYLRDHHGGLGKQRLTAGQWLGAFAHAPEPADLALIHFSHPAAVARFMESEGEILLTTGSNAASIRAAYLNIKRTCARSHRYRVVVVGEGGASSAAIVHSRISGTALRFLGIAPDYAGEVPAPHHDAKTENTETTMHAFAQLASRTLGWRLAEFPALRGTRS